jgi:hypothetical protein
VSGVGAAVRRFSAARRAPFHVVVSCVGASVSVQGFAVEEEIEGLRDPHIAIHGSFSFMVNFHALKSYFDGKGGFTVQSVHQDGFKVGCCAVACRLLRGVLCVCARACVLCCVVLCCVVLCVYVCVCVSAVTTG